MNRFFTMLLCIAFANNIQAQELFTYTEPASNMPVKAIGIRANNFVMQPRVASQKTAYNVAPEIMVGLSKKIMVHGEAFFGNKMNQFNFDGASFYAKYRFLSNDDVHRHFRMALYGKVATSNIIINQNAIDLAGRNSGAELGLVATQLINKVAISAGGSFVNAFDNGNNNKLGAIKNANKAINYNLSLGKLFLPKTYENYNQVNVNGMVEWLGQTNTFSGKTFIDVAPSIQFIFYSKARLDVGYRFPLIDHLERNYNKGFLVRFEYNFFNAF